MILRVGRRLPGCQHAIGMLARKLFAHYLVAENKHKYFFFVFSSLGVVSGSLLAVLKVYAINETIIKKREKRERRAERKMFESNEIESQCSMQNAVCLRCLSLYCVPG